jgi:NAD(P)-dependent dehydrogenase (short-subunit alcohol dehydrogenase family)
MSADGKIALVTGAGSGVGKAAALALLKAGFKTVLAGRRLDALEKTASEAGATGDKCLCVSTDVSDPASVDALYARINEAYGRLDVLFNNAGTNVPGATIDELTPEQWRQVIDVNLTGSFLCARGAFAMMKNQNPQGGRIINNGSISAYAPRPGSAPYTASKHAITGLTKTISLDGRPFDIACGQIDIGNAATEMAYKMAEGVPQANGEIGVEPLMDVAHVGDSVAHMASLPLSANVMFMNVMATKMPFAGRG